MTTIEIAGTLEPAQLEERCRVASEELRESLDTLESHLQTSIAVANADGDSELSAKLFSGLLWVRMRRQPSHAERYCLEMAASV